jgi:hypothetical protein
VVLSVHAATPAFLVDATSGVKTPVTQACFSSCPGDGVQNLDATLIEDSIGSGALCAECIVRITGVPSSRLNDVLPRLIGALRIASRCAMCRNCLRDRIVHRLE